MLVLCKEREGYYEVIFKVWIRFNRFYSSYDFLKCQMTALQWEIKPKRCWTKKYLFAKVYYIPVVSYNKNYL